MRSQKSPQPVFRKGNYPSRERESTSCQSGAGEKRIISRRARRGAEIKASLGLLINEKGDDLFSVNSAGSSAAGERKELSLTERSEAAEIIMNLELFTNEIVANISSVLPAGSIEAGER